MKRLLIIGASILQLPAIKRAKELGYYVGVADYNQNAVGISYAHEYCNASTIDVEEIMKVAKKFQPDGILTLATDMPMRSVAAATEELGLPGIAFETAIKATDKGEMIKAFKKYKVEIPWFFIVNNKNDLNLISNNLSYPCIIKPTDNAGSRGVILVSDYDELEKSYYYSKGHSRSGTVIIEEYMEGNEVSVEVICVGGNPHILAITDKLTTGAPHFVEMGHSQPSKLKTEDLEEIKSLAKQAVKAVGIQQGPAHVEIILTEDGPKMVELGARLGGDCITTHLVPLSTGIDMVEATIRLACNEIPDISLQFQKGSAIRYIPSMASGRLNQIKGLDDAMMIEGVKEIVITKNIGDYISEFSASTDRLGYVIVQADTVYEAIKACELALNKIKVEIDSNGGRFGFE